jgi:hypothetical protein
MKLDVEGFPHSSQDAETMTCAETTIWALMEYYGNKYPEYRPTLPSRIVKTLEDRTYQRQLPSKGLSYQDISYALKTYGFGPIVYSKKDFGKEDFKSIFSCYVESGIPVVVLIDDADGRKLHAISCIGRLDIDGDKMSMMRADSPEKWENKIVYDWNANIDSFVFMDDNRPPYEVAEYSKPLANYGGDYYLGCKIAGFIVPLYHKIYLRAEEAMRISSRIAREIVKISNNSVIRTFLTSSRSYKNYVFKKAGAERELKTIISQTELPKFIWVTEVSSLDDRKRNHINGAIILDATGSNIEYLESFVMAYYEGVIYKFSKKDNLISKYLISLPQKYKVFEGNLKLSK